MWPRGEQWCLLITGRHLTQNLDEMSDSLTEMSGSETDESQTIFRTRWCSISFEISSKTTYHFKNSLHSVIKNTSTYNLSTSKLNRFICQFVQTMGDDRELQARIKQPKLHRIFERTNKDTGFRSTEATSEPRPVRLSDRSIDYKRKWRNGAVKRLTKAEFQKGKRQRTRCFCSLCPATAGVVHAPKRLRHFRNLITWRAI